MIQEQAIWHVVYSTQCRRRPILTEVSGTQRKFLDSCAFRGAAVFSSKLFCLCGGAGFINLETCDVPLRCVCVCFWFHYRNFLWRSRCAPLPISPRGAARMQRHHAVRLLRFEHAGSHDVVAISRATRSDGAHRWDADCHGGRRGPDRRRPPFRLPTLLLRLRSIATRVRPHRAGIESGGQLAALSADVAGAGNGRRATWSCLRPRATYLRRCLDGV